MTGQTLRYKFLNLFDGELRSSVGDQTWQLGAWEEVAGEPELCKYGFHCCERPYDALNYVKGNILARVEVGGMVTPGSDKEAWQKMSVADARYWRKVDSVRLAVFCAELVLHLYEKRYPDDKRPRAAIDAAKAWVENPSVSAVDAVSAREEIWAKINGWMDAHFQQLERYGEGER